MSNPKLHQKMLSRQARLFKFVATEERGWSAVWPRLHWNICLRDSVVENLGFSQRKSMLCLIYTTSGIFTTWSKALTKIGFLPSHRDWDIRHCLPRWLYFKEMGAWSSRKTVLGCKTGKRLFKRFTSQRGRERKRYKERKVTDLEAERSLPVHSLGKLRTILMLSWSHHRKNWSGHTLT